MTLDIDGREVVRRPVTLLPGANEVRWEASTAGAEVAAVSVADSGGYRWDDTRYVLLGAARPTVVHVVANSGTLDAEAFYLARALEAAPRDNRFEVLPVAPAAVAALEASGWEAGDVILVTGTDGLSRPARARIAAFVESGGGLFLAVGPGVDSAPDPRRARRRGRSGGRGLRRCPRERSHEPARGRRSAPPRVPALRGAPGDARSGAFHATARVALPERRDGPAGEDRRPRVLARFRSGRPGADRVRPGGRSGARLRVRPGGGLERLPAPVGFVPFCRRPSGIWPARASRRATCCRPTRRPGSRAFPA